MTQQKVIVTCAVTGSAPTVGKHPAIPVTPAVGKLPEGIELTG